MNSEATYERSTRRQQLRRGAPVQRPAVVAFQRATSADAEALHGLIDRHVDEGRLLPRQLDELRAHATRFIVASRRGCIVGCAELAPVSARVAEIRSLVVARSARNAGIGRTLVGGLQARASKDGFQVLCAFTHDTGFFVRHGYSIVPHASLHEKIALDCQHCRLFGRCGQSAVQLSLVTPWCERPATRANRAQRRGEVVA